MRSFSMWRLYVMPRCYRISSNCTFTTSVRRSPPSSWGLMGASVTTSFPSTGQNRRAGSHFLSDMASESQDSYWSHVVHRRPMILPSSISPSSSFFVAIVAPGWVAERLSFSGIVFPVDGSFAFPRGTEALFPSGRASLPSTRGAPQQRASVLAFQIPGACSLSTAHPRLSPSDSGSMGIVCPSEPELSGDWLGGPTST